MHTPPFHRFRRNKKTKKHAILSEGLHYDSGDSNGSDRLAHKGTLLFSFVSGTAGPSAFDSKTFIEKGCHEGSADVRRRSQTHTD